jgi:hypothetical protein
MTRRAAERPSAPLWRAAAALAALLFLLHLFAAATARDPRMILPHGVAWLHDVSILALLGGGFTLLARLRGRALPRVARVTGCGALVATAMLLALYPRMLQEFLAAPANVLDADAATAGTFVRDYLGVCALWPAAVALVVGVAGCRSSFPLPGRRGLVAGAPLLVLSVLALGRDSPNPVVFGLQDGVRRLREPRAVPRIRTTPTDEPAPPASPAVDWSPAAREARYEHVVLAVLEGVTAADFESGFVRRPEGFFARHRHHARRFARYYSTNLDSYTALVAMTTSIQVPFRAYAAPERYASVNDAPNLARGLRGAGFRGLFVSTYEHQPFVPNPRDWDVVLDRRDLGDLGGWTSLGSSRMEAATEDRAALPAIVDFMRAGSRSLVLAELVFGHSPEWRVRTGLTPVEYHDRYLADLWDRLTAAGLVSRTLLVVVSDHGERSRPSDPENYRVPLLVVGEGIAPGEDRALRSHLDLQAVVGHVLVGTPMPGERSAVTLVGSTERWIYGVLRADGSHLFIDDGGGRVLSGNLAASRVHEAFQAQVSAFGSAFLARRP